jgi:stage V sporulation protein B
VYQVSTSLFGVFLTLGTGGLPVTVSRFVTRFKAENSLKKQNSTLSAGLFLAFCASFLPALLFWLFGRFFTNLIPDERCLPTLKILLIGGVFSALFAVLRGRQWGENNFIVPSLFELLEQALLVISGIVFLSFDIKIPLLERVAWANAFSSALVFFLALGFLILQKTGFGSPLPLAKELFRSALPITAVRIFSSLLVSVVAVLLPKMLVLSGYSSTEAIKLYGVLTGMVLPVLFIPATLIGSLSLVLSPRLSEDFYKKNTDKLKQNINRGLTLSLLLSGVLVPLVFVVGEEVGGLIFSSALAGKMIEKGAPILLPMSLSMFSTSAMNALGNQKISLKFYLYGAVTLLASILLFSAKLSGYSYLIGMGLNFTTTALCNLLFLHKRKLLSTSFFKKLLLVCALFLPIASFGQVVKALCLSTLGGYFGVSVIALLVTGFAVAVWFFVKKRSFKEKN